MSTVPVSEIITKQRFYLTQDIHAGRTWFFNTDTSNTSFADGIYDLTETSILVKSGW